jgi:hypothetical protein
MQLCVDILSRELEAYATTTPTDETEKKTRDASPTWQAKQQAIQILHRIFQRYYNLQYLKDHYLTIGSVYVREFSSPVLTLCIQYLFGSKTVYVPNILLNYFLKYLIHAMKVDATM